MQKLKTILQFNKYLLILVLVVFISLLRNNFEDSSIYNDDTKNVIGKVVSVVKSEDKLSLTIKASEKVLGNYYGDKDFNINLGDTVKISGEMNRPNNNTVPNTFNYKNYLNNKNIFYVMTIDNIEIIKENNNIFYKIKNSLIKKIEKYEYYDYLYTFILGNKNYLDDDVYESYRINGVVHLFCISGSHISLLVGCILFVFRKLNLNIVLSYFMVFILLVFYMFLTDYGASVLRSCVFFILLGLKKLDYLKLDIKDVFFLTIIILLLINPNLLNDIGFLYSASITYGLLISERLIKGNYITKTFIISFIASLVSFPITINNFFEINLLGIIYNIVFVPLVTFILTPLAFLTIIFSFLEPILGIIIQVLEFISLKFNLIQVNLVVPKMNYIFIVVYYFILYSFLTKKNKYLIYLILLIFMIKLIPYVDKNYYVYFLDVNQGDSTLIKYKDEIILIDTGGIISFDGSSDYYISDKTITLIKSLGFSSLDYLILTHGDYDHMGDASYLVKNFKVEKVILNCGEYNELEQELIKVLDERKISYYSCIKELNIDNNKLYFLNNNDYGNENDNSNVIYTELNNYKVLFMGDAGIEVEEDLLEKYNLQNIDVLKVGHHGSKTSSSEEFIDEINPKYSIISVGKNNRYGHPNKDVLNNLENSTIYRTDKHGSIMFKIKNNKLEIETCVP